MIYVVTNCEGKIQPIAKSFAASGMAAPVGAITPGFAENEKWKYCEGQQLSKKEYPALFDIIGYTFGGEGDYFCLPDMREYVPCGAGKRTSNTSEEMILGRCYESQIGSHTHAQAAHCHCRPAHTHTGVSHAHNGTNHSHTYLFPNIPAGCRYQRYFYSIGTCGTTCVYDCYSSIISNTPTPTTSGTTSCVSSSNADTLNSATAVNCATGCADGITRGRRYGMRYIIRVA